MSVTTEPIVEYIRHQQAKARRYFNMLYKTEKEKRKHRKVLNEILFQIEICEPMLIHLSGKTLIRWLQFDTVRKVEVAASNLKFA